MLMTWKYDAPDGVYKNHEMSAKLREQAIADAIFMQFVTPEPGYGKKKGESISITRISSIPATGSARLVEGQKIDETEVTLSVVAITVSEFGKAVPFSSLLEDLSSINIENSVQKELRRNMKLELDISAAEAFKTTPVKAIPNGQASIVFDTDGTPSTQATANLNFYHVEQIRDLMKTDLLIPEYEDGNYIGLVSTKAKRGIMNDPKFEVWNKYTTPEKKYNSEIGKLEGIRFIEVNHTQALSGALGLNGVLGEAVIFGDDAVAMAVAVEPELRAKVPTDFGRSKAVAWYGVLEFGLVWNSANAGEAKVIHVTSA